MYCLQILLSLAQFDSINTTKRIVWLTCCLVVKC